MTYSPNLPINSGWKSTIQNAFQILRRIKFIIEGDFSFGNFDPQTNYLGMTVTNYNMQRARYIKIGNLFLFSISISATVAAPLAAAIFVTIPYTAKSEGGQYGSSFMIDAGVQEVGNWGILTDTNQLFFIRAASAAFGAGVNQITVNGFIEVN